MGMSTHVVGFIPPDETWQKLKAVHDACVNAGVEVPYEVECVVGSNPTDYGREIEISVKEWNDDARQGYDVAVSSLPADVTVIRFYNSW